MKQTACTSLEETRNEGGIHWPSLEVPLATAFEITRLDNFQRLSMLGIAADLFILINTSPGNYFKNKEVILKPSETRGHCLIS